MKNDKATATGTAKDTVKAGAEKLAEVTKEVAEKAVEKAAPIVKETAEKVSKKTSTTRKKASETAKKVSDKATKVKEKAKTAAKKTGEAKKSVEKAVKSTASRAKKLAGKNEMIVQYAGKSFTTDDLVKRAREVWKKEMHRKLLDFGSVQLYVKTEENMVYFVVNGTEEGKFSI